jgi:tRNA(adenine34) deaminase
MQWVAVALCSADFHGTTLQPWGMAAIWSKIGRIVFGAAREDLHRLYFEDRHLNTFDFIADAFRDDLVLIGGVLGDCAALYYGPGDNLPPEDRAPSDMPSPQRSNRQ